MENIQGARQYGAAHYENRQSHDQRLINVNNAPYSRFFDEDSISEHSLDNNIDSEESNLFNRNLTQLYAEMGLSQNGLERLLNQGAYSESPVTSDNLPGNLDFYKSIDEIRSLIQRFSQTGQAAWKIASPQMYAALKNKTVMLAVASILIAKERQMLLNLSLFVARHATYESSKFSAKLLTYLSLQLVHHKISKAPIDRYRRRYRPHENSWAVRGLCRTAMNSHLYLKYAHPLLQVILANKLFGLKMGSLLVVSERLGSFHKIDKLIDAFYKKRLLSQSRS